MRNIVIELSKGHLALLIILATNYIIAGSKKQVTTKNLFCLRHMTYGLKIDLAASLRELMVSQFKTPKHLIVLKDGFLFQ